MKQFTSHNARRIIGLILIALTVAAILIPTVLKIDATGKSLWQSIFMQGIDSSGRLILIIYGVILLLCIVITCLSIPAVINKGKRTHYVNQAFVTIFLVGLIIFDRIKALFNLTQIIILVVAIGINLLASVYYILCIVYNHDEMYFEPEIIFNDAPELEENIIENEEK